MTNFIKDTKKVVGCDLDDVLADFVSRFMEIAARKYGVDGRLRPTSWEWDGIVDDPVKKQEYIDGTWDEILHTPNFWETLDRVNGVDRDLVYELDRATKLYFPTARAITHGGIDVGRQSAKWLWNNFTLRYPTVFVSDEKGPLAAALKYDYFIDDRPKNCLAIKQARPECKVFMKDASHNQSVTLDGIPRIPSVNEFAQLVLKGE